MKHQDTTPTLIAAVVLLRHDGAALLQHRDNKPGLPRAGMWVMPGGHCEPEESDRQCARREFYEETNYRCTELHRLVTMIDTNDVTGEKHLLAVFWSHYDGVQQPKCQEGQDLRFVTCEESMSLNVPPHLIDAWNKALQAARIEKAA